MHLCVSRYKNPHKYHAKNKQWTTHALVAFKYPPAGTFYGHYQ